MALYDISRRIAPGIAVWPGDTPFQNHFVMQMQKGDSCNVGTVTMSVHTGSHTDAPFHFEDRGLDISEVPLDKYLGPATVIEIPSAKCIEPRHIVGLDYGKTSRILFKTKASARPNDAWDEDFVYLSEAAAELLGQNAVQLVGLDSPSVDPFRSKTLTAHKILLRYGVAILEGLNLQAVPPGEYELIALPLKLAGLDASPVRAVLRR
jgi:arylformamidase